MVWLGSGFIGSFMGLDTSWIVVVIEVFMKQYTLTVARLNDSLVPAHLQGHSIVRLARPCTYEHAFGYYIDIKKGVEDALEKVEWPATVELNIG